MKTYYVYKIKFIDGTFYIGYRGSKKKAADDFLISYRSSSKVVKEKMKTCEFTGLIVEDSLSKEVAYNLEQRLIFDEIQNENCLNKVCFYGREGFGLLTESARQKISEDNKKRWSDPEYRDRVSQSHKQRWKNLNLKEKQIARLTGVKRPDHSEKLKGRTVSNESKSKMRKPKHPGHGKAVSLATRGVPKSESHKEKLRGPKPRVCRLTDRKEMSVNHYTRWLNSLLSQEKKI